jgi:hypothetical protein
LKPGQTLRLGQIEMRLDSSDAPAPAKKLAETTIATLRGVSLNELEQGTRGGMDTVGKGFSKKDNKVNKIFLIGGVIVGLIIVALVVYAIMSAGH